ncbi:MAG: ATP-binding protein [Deltaproteobacteria bacterium]|jgi:PAS domain S-box-containing protein|nr:ATP-binding protein [Deltaproteobacteria bacterium]MDL1987254.1 ATP-binding protein [Deltaproteobacteria bacterium]
MKIRPANIILPLIIFLCLSSITVVLWQDHTERDEEIMLRHTETAVEQIHMRLEDFMEERLSSLEVLADRWVERRPPDFSYTRYRQFAETYFKHYPGFQAINWVDPDGFIRWVYPEEQNYAAKDKNLHNHPETAVRESFARAERDRKYVITPCVKLLQGGLGFATYWPLIYDGKMQGYINGVFNISSVIKLRIGENIFDEFRLALYEGDRLIYQHGFDKELMASNRSVRATREIHFSGKTWRLELEPLRITAKNGLAAYLGLENPTHLMFLFFGLTLSTGLSFLVYSFMHRMQMYQVARDQALYEVNERKHAEQEIQDLQRYNRGLIETSPDPLVTFDQKGIILDVNEATIKATGGTREELTGTPFADYFTDPEKAHKGAMLVFETGEVRDYELVMKGDGSETIVSYNASVYEDQTGQVVGAFAAARNITDQRRLEQEREVLLKELSDKNEELQTFVYSVSHDLKTPIVTIEGFIGAMREDFGDLISEEQEKYIKYMSDAALKMEALINDLLEFSRIGRMTEKKSKFSFAGLVKEILKTLRPQIQARGIEVDIQEDLPDIYGGKKRFIQVMENLLTNAVKYIGKENPCPRIDVGAQDRDGQKLFFVRDNGIGIEKRYFDKIFQVFQRLPAAKKHGEGTGVGLAIVKRIIELNGGKIWLTSEPGKGSTFFFQLNLS